MLQSFVLLHGVTSSDSLDRARGELPSTAGSSAVPKADEQVARASRN